MPDSKDTLLVEKRDDVWIVSLNRPEVKNAVNPATARKLAATFAEFDQDDTAKIAVFEGAHGTFCAGADLKAVSQGDFAKFEIPSKPIDPLSQDGPMGPS